MNSKRIFVAVIFCCLACAGCGHRTPYLSPGQQQENGRSISETEILSRYLFIGDTGAPREGSYGNVEPVLQTLEIWAKEIPDRTRILFLGDNLYEEGMPSPEHGRDNAGAIRRLEASLRIVEESGAKAVFVPGNHDWDDGGKSGLVALKLQAEYISGRLPELASFLPKPGDPGPVLVEDVPSPEVSLIVLDTQWWFQRMNNDSSEFLIQKDQFASRLSALLESLKETDVIIVGHHPLVSYGRHGGFYDWRDHLFPMSRLWKWFWIPLPGVGSFYPLGRGLWFPSVQDLAHPENEILVSRLNHLLAKTRPLIYASGHEHSLQVLEGNSARYLLVSGAGSSAKITPVTHGDDTLFAHSHTGFMSVDFLIDGSVLLRVIEPENRIVYMEWLKR